MADISSYIRLIELASRGEDVRDAIINALNSINQGAFGEFDDVPTAGSGKAVTSGAIKTALDGKQDLLTFDNTPTQGSDNPVKSGGIYSAIEAMQGALQFDDTPTENSTNPVTSGGIYNALQGVEITMDETPTEGSEHAVKSGGIKTALDAKQDTLQYDSAPTPNSSKLVTSGGMWAAISGISSVESIHEVTLYQNAWTGNGPYTQEVSIQGVTAASKIDIQADAAAISQLLSDEVRAVWVENNNGTVTVYSIGAVPTEDITVQCSVENITSPYEYDSVPTENSTNLVLSGGVWSALQNVSVETDVALSSSSTNPLQNKAIYEALAGKVDKANGKGLSTNDYTAEEKEKLAGIEAGATKTYVDAALSTYSTNPVMNKVVYTALGNKVDKVSGKGLSENDYTTAEKQKLAGIEAGANKTVVDSSLSGSSENPVQNKVIYEALAEKVDKVSGKGLSENDYTTSEKQKLAGIETGANKTVVDSSLSSSSLNPVQNKVIYEALQSFVTSWDDLTGKPSTLAGYGITADTLPTENSTNPVESGGIYDALEGKEDISNKISAITANSTNDEYPSAAAVWSLITTLQDSISGLSARVAELENRTSPTTVRDNILVLQSGQMNGTILEPVGATIGQDNILTFGQSSESVTADMENNILTLGNVSMDSNILTINDDVMDGTTMEF